MLLLSGGKVLCNFSLYDDAEVYSEVSAYRWRRCSVNKCKGEKQNIYYVLKDIGEYCRHTSAWRSKGPRY